MMKKTLFILLFSLFIASRVEGAFPYTVTHTATDINTGSTILPEHSTANDTDHINNNIPESIDDFSATVAEMKQTRDPYAASTEVLAVTLDDEIESLRYMIGELNYRNTNWYEDDNPIPIFRSTLFKIEPGATPGTDINITTTASSSRGYNSPTITDVTDLAKGASSGSFALNAAGTLITFDITENILGILSTSLQIHDINSSSTTELYTPWVDLSSNNIRIGIVKRPNNSASIDITTLMDAGDTCEILISYITST